MPTPVYGIFEGGGAKGLAHIAGVEAAERNGLEFIGVAGASAGRLSLHSWRLVMEQEIYLIQIIPLRIFSTDIKFRLYRLSA